MTAPIVTNSAGGYWEQPSLGIDFLELKKIVADKLSMSLTATDWSTTEHDRLRMYVNEAYRNLLMAHDWTWKKPHFTITCWASIATSSGTTVTGSYYEGVTTLTASAAAFYRSMEGKTITITGVDDFTLDEYVSSTVFKLKGEDASAASAATFSITADGNYTLPRDWGGLDGMLTFGQNEGFQPIALTSDSNIRYLRQYNHGSSRPYTAAIRPKASHSGGSVQRWELMTHPTADSTYNLTGRYYVNARKLTENNPYPIGADNDAIAQLLLLSCLATAEKRGDDEVGVHSQEYAAALQIAIQRDKEAFAPESLGYNADLGSSGSPFSHGREAVVRFGGNSISHTGVTSDGITPSMT